LYFGCQSDESFCSKFYVAPHLTSLYQDTNWKLHTKFVGIFIVYPYTELYTQSFVNYVSKEILGILCGLHISYFIDCKNSGLPSHVFQIVCFQEPVILCYSCKVTYISW
jgi:hypothetical protein